jgi:hypothetical protein
VPVVGKWSTAQDLTRVGVVRKYYAHYPPQAGDPPPTPPFYWALDGGNAWAGNAPVYHQPDSRSFAFGGLQGDVFVTGNWWDTSWPGTGLTAAGVYRNGEWVLDAALPGAPQSQHVAGLNLSYGGLTQDIPLAGHWGWLPIGFATTSMTAQVGVNFQETVPVVGGSGLYNFTRMGGTLPAGLSFFGGVGGGLVSGVPTTTGSSTLSVQVRDLATGSQTGTTAITINVVDFAMGTPSPSSVSLAPGGSAATVSVPITSLNGFSGTVPVYCDQSGLILTGCSSSVATNVTVPGTLTVMVQAPAGLPARVYTITIGTRDSLSGHSVTLPVNVVATPIITTTSALSQAQAGGYSQTFLASGGKTPYSWSAGSTLPPGLALSSAGVLSGTVSGGIYSFTVQVTDSIGVSSMAPFNLSVGYFTAPLTLSVKGNVGQQIALAFALTSVDGYYNQSGNILFTNPECANATLSYPNSVQFGAANETVT